MATTRKYMITLIEHVIFDVEVEATSIGAAIDAAHDTPRDKWIQDDLNTWVSTGKQHIRFDEDGSVVSVDTDKLEGLLD